MLLTVIGLSVLTAGRIKLRTIEAGNDAAEARLLAVSAVEDALTVLATNPNWRTQYQNNVIALDRSVGRGSIQWKLVDEIDGSLSNNATDSVRVYGIGRVRTAARLYSVRLRPQSLGIAALKTPFHAGGSVTVTNNSWFTGGPLSSNGNVAVPAGITVYGDVEAASVSNAGTITGVVTTPAPPKPMPGASVFDLWKAKATSIPYANIPGGKIEKVLLSNAVNPYGPTDANGCYYIDVPSKGSLLIDQCRIVGSLIIRLTDDDLTIKSGVVWEPYRKDYPTLVVNCGLDSKTTVDMEGGGALFESSYGVNFNPPGTPYNGQTNNDTSDLLLSRLRGLIHIIRTPGNTAVTTVNATQYYVGTVLVDGTIHIKDGTFVLDGNLFRNAPEGYSDGNEMRPVSGTWRWEKDG